MNQKSSFREVPQFVSRALTANNGLREFFSRVHHLRRAYLICANKGGTFALSIHRAKAVFWRVMMSPVKIDSSARKDS
jgi:hypothetical protein